MQQLMRYTAVGGIAALVEWGSFAAQVYWLDIFYVWAAVVSFAIATLVNYQLCVLMVFPRSQTAWHVPLFRSYVVSIAAVGINLGILMAMAEWLSSPLMLAKICGTGGAFVLNFLGRKHWAFR